MAAGLTVPEENIPALRSRLTEIYRQEGGGEPESVLHIDAELTKARILSAENVEALDRLEPYGNGNPQPVFCIRDAEIVSVTAVGGGKHTRVWLRKQGETLEGIFFSHSPQMLGVEAGKRVEAAFSPQLNVFRGRTTVQLNLIDIRVY